MKTLTPKQLNSTERKWYVVDAEGQTLGRLSTIIATTLRGKNKVDFASHVDNGDYVVVINADKFAVTGNKMKDKLYHRHTGYLGGLISTPLEKLLVKKPTRALEAAVSGMLPKNKLRQDMQARLKLFAGAEHTYAAQKPETLSL
jgi:large subunit ribosomal protein L13